MSLIARLPLLGSRLLVWERSNEGREGGIKEGRKVERGKED